MFLPLYDGVPLRHVTAPLVTRALIGACITAYLATQVGISAMGEGWIIAGLGTIPSVLFGYDTLPAGLPLVPEPATLVTSLFLHASLLHLGGNMLFLFVFGDNVEDALGHARFLLFYLLCGIGAGLAHAFSDVTSPNPLIGASGAISGVVGAYLILHPRVQLWGLFLKGIPLRLRASWAIGFWIAFQIVAALLGLDSGVGWYAHVGGFVAGAILVFVLRRPRRPLFDGA